MQQQEIEKILEELSGSGLGDKAKEALLSKLLEQIPGFVVQAAVDPLQTQEQPILAVLAGLVMVVDRFGQFAPHAERFTVRTSWREFLRSLVRWMDAHPEILRKLRADLGVGSKVHAQIGQAASVYQELLGDAPAAAPVPATSSTEEAETITVPTAPTAPVTEDLSVIVESMRALILEKTSEGIEVRKAVLRTLQIDGRPITDGELEAGLMAGKTAKVFKAAGTGRGTHYVLV
jgi:hypothetical protein